MNPYYADDHVTIYHGDCREALPTLAGVTATVFSPPYNVALDYDEHDDVMPWEEYEDLALEVCSLTLKAQPHGRTWVNVTPVVPGIPIPAGDHSGRSANPRRSLLGIWTRALGAPGPATTLPRSRPSSP